MTSLEYGDAQNLWKMFYARQCFQQARGAAQHILDAKLEWNSPLFTPLVTAVHVLYAKPFTRADAVGRLGEEIVPQEHRELHCLLLKHRHEIYAHRDGDAFSVGDHGPASQVRAIRLPTEIQLLATDFNARFTAMPGIIGLCQELEKKTTYHVDKLWSKYAKSVPKIIGEYMLNVQNQTGEMWLPQEPMVLKKAR